MPHLSYRDCEQDCGSWMVVRMIPCVRINDFGIRKCQEYCIYNPRMKCRGAIRCTVEYAYSVYFAIDTSVSYYEHFHIFMKAIVKHALQMKRERYKREIRVFR